MQNFNQLKKAGLFSVTIILVFFIIILMLHSCKDEDNLVNNAVKDNKTLTITVRDSCVIENPIAKAKVFLAPGKNVAKPLGEEFFIGETDTTGNFNYDMKGRCDGAVYTLEVEGADNSVLAGVRRRIDSLFLTCCNDNQLVVFPITRVTVNVSDDCNNLLNGAKVFLAKGANTPINITTTTNLAAVTNSNGIAAFSLYIDKPSDIYTILILGPDNSQHKDSIIQNNSLTLVNCSDNLNFKFKCSEEISCTDNNVSKTLSFKYCVDTNNVNQYFSQSIKNDPKIPLRIRFVSISTPFPNSNTRIDGYIIVANQTNNYNGGPFSLDSSYQFLFKMTSDIDASYKGVLKYQILRADNNTVCYELVLDLNFAAEKCGDCPCPKSTEFNYPEKKYPVPDTTCTTPLYPPITITLNTYNSNQKNCEWIYTIKKDFVNKSAFALTTITKTSSQPFNNSFSLKPGETLRSIGIDFKATSRGLYNDSIVFSIKKNNSFGIIDCIETMVVRVSMFKEEGDNCTDCRCPNSVTLIYPDSVNKKFPVPDFVCGDSKLIPFTINLKNPFNDICDWNYKIEKNFSNTDAYVLDNFNGKTGTQFTITKGQTLSNISIRFKPQKSGLFIDTIIFSVQTKDKYGNYHDCSEKIVIMLSMYKGEALCTSNLPDKLDFGTICYARTSDDQWVNFINDGGCDLNCQINASITGTDAEYFRLNKSQINGINKQSSNSFAISFSPTCSSVLTDGKLDYNAQLRISSSCPTCPTKTIPLSGKADSNRIDCGKVDPKKGNPSIEEKTVAIELKFSVNSWTTVPLDDSLSHIYASLIDTTGIPSVTFTTITGGKFKFIANKKNLNSNSSPCEFWQVYDYSNLCETNNGVTPYVAHQGDLVMLTLPNGNCVVFWVNSIYVDNQIPPKKDVKINLCFINCQ